MKVERFVSLINIKEEICLCYETTILIFAYKYAFQSMHLMVYFTRDCIFLSILTRRAKLPRMKY